RFLHLFEQVCQTVAYAHSRGVIHRDLKPANIMVGAFGEVQVMDWGLAKVLGKEADRVTGVPSPQYSVLSTSSDLPASCHETPREQTQRGAVMGTPGYLAPEQARGEVDKLDERCDVFGLGAILCEMLTGKPPCADVRQAAEGDLADAYAALD